VSEDKYELNLRPCVHILKTNRKKVEMKKMFALLVIVFSLSTVLNAKPVALATWMGGSQTMDQPGVYGSKGVADTANVPGARSGGAYEFDWLYVGDFQGDDCDVDLRDFSVLALNWQQDNSAIDIAPFAKPDGIIDFNELIVIANHWLNGTLQQ